MKKTIKKIVIDGKEIEFAKAELYVGNNKGITYILSLESKGPVKEYLQQVEIEILTTENEAKIIEGTLGTVRNNHAIFYIAGEPFPVTDQEMRKFM